MGPDQTVEMMRKVLMEAMMLSAPLLVTACLVSLLVSLAQTLTSVQEQTLTAVPRLVVVFGVTMTILPWVVHRLVSFTLHMLTGFHKYLG
ncbi:flagellar biosynthetic protein FliQ [Edaphobacter aggregans]|jgi:flagellar biosynthesis protein FliQ|uniref:Flagellar biosynthetic protein FliQ n=1 Tax=Edaphobacter aggregans TaxID=570835 RepID=A0A3R9WL04_9BACT|nr:flagellar biosynthetic protein FliQ [Edaphobacter aggregans]RSL19466.1 flagellar biosynthetic protein FliQ [Edaphobacter aggregans]